MSKSFELMENNVKLNVGIVETIGYGDQINKQKSCQAIIDYIDAKFEGYLQEELQISRKLNTFRDGRIHVCLYFITPTGHGLKALDLICMKQLDSKVNLIPVIAKSDIISKQDLIAFKRRVQSELTNSGVQIYQFPVDDPMSPQDANRQYNALMPFAVIGSRDLVRVGTKMVRARQYPWGVVQIENEAHCDFTRLRDAVLRYNLADLVESTHVKHYELYRRMRLIAMGFGDAGIGDSSTFERKWAEHRASLQKREDDMRQTFVDKVSATSPANSLSGANFNHSLRDDSLEKRDEGHRGNYIKDEAETNYSNHSSYNQHCIEQMDLSMVENNGCSLSLIFDEAGDEESLIWDDYFDELRYSCVDQVWGQSADDQSFEGLRTYEGSKPAFTAGHCNSPERIRETLRNDQRETKSMSFRATTTPKRFNLAGQNMFKISKEGSTQAQIDINRPMTNALKTSRLSDNLEYSMTSEYTGRVRMLASKFDNSFQ
ncbi:septin-2-like isoform X2 [Varroa destructor]|nr:septin-2-like isoform X2 [Varroa destructor]